MPRVNKRVLCVEESILLPSGSGVQTVMLDERYTPYKKQSARIENLCGSFTEFVHTGRLEGASKRQGNQRELFHVQGNVVINQGKALFLAARGVDGLEHLARAMNLSSPDNVTHMIVLTSKIGKRVQVCAHGLLERSLARQMDQIKVKGRIFEHTNSVCFSLTRFDKLPFFLPCQLRPDKNDWTVTGKGMIIIRLIWQRLAWNREAEEACLTMCDLVTEWLHGCC